MGRIRPLPLSVNVSLRVKLSIKKSYPGHGTKKTKHVLYDCPFLSRIWILLRKFFRPLFEIEVRYNIKTLLINIIDKLAIYNLEKGDSWAFRDLVAVPEDLEAGKYVLSFRWDCQNSPQIWSSCANINIL